jgi:hypothetical protein
VWVLTSELLGSELLCNQVSTPPPTTTHTRTHARAHAHTHASRCVDGCTQTRARAQTEQTVAHLGSSRERNMVICETVSCGSLESQTHSPQSVLYTAQTNSGEPQRGPVGPIAVLGGIVVVVIPGGKGLSRLSVTKARCSDATNSNLVATQYTCTQGRVKSG